MEDKDIDRLIEILRTSRDEETRREAAESLGKIGTGNSTAIEALAELLRTSRDERTRLLSPQALQFVAHFLTYRAENESELATYELLEIPGFMESFERGQKDIQEGRVAEWRSIRSDL